MSTTQFIQSLLKWLASPGQYASQLGEAIRSAGDLWSSTETQSKLDEKISGVRAGENVTIDVSDPYNPKINAVGTGFGDMAASVYDPTEVEADAFDRANHHGNMPAANVTDLATVATSGSYNDLTDKPAAGGDVTGPAGATAGNFPTLDATGKVLSDSGAKPADFATAAQGAKADSALQAADLAPTVHAASSKATPVDADEIGLVDSAASNVLKKLTWANLKATVRTYLLGVANIWSAPQMGAITPLSVASGLIAWDAASGNDFEVTLTANAVWQFPSNASTHVGQKGRLLIKQNATGGWTFGVASGFKVLGSASLPAILTAANAESYAAYEIIASGTVLISLAGVGG